MERLISRKAPHRGLGWLLVLGVCLGRMAGVGAQQVVTTATEEALQSALRQGGLVYLNLVSNTIRLSKPLEVGLDTSLINTGMVSAISGENATRIFIVKAGVRFHLENVGLVAGRVSNSNQLGSVLSSTGAAIHNAGGLVSLANVTFSGNVTTGFAGSAGASNGNDQGGTDGAEGMGGALFSLGGSISATNCIFVGNVAMGGAGGAGGNGRTGGLGANGGDGGDGGSGWGGAVYLKSSIASFTSCLFTNNAATGAVGGMGGVGSGLLGFNGRNGAAGSAFGGAIFYETGSLLVARSTFARNSATGAVGQSGKAVGGSLAGESGGHGGAALGGVLRSLSAATIQNCTFWENSATGGAGGNGGAGSNYSFGFDGGRGGDGGAANGGALHMVGGLLIHNTFSGNGVAGGSAGRGGAGAGFVGRAGASGNAGGMAGGSILGATAAPTLANSVILAGAGGGVSGLLGDAGGNVVSDMSPLLIHPATLANTPPGLAMVLALNGGATPTLGLATNSPAINRGVDDYCLAVDQRGTNRLDRCDSGAFETAPSNLPPLLVSISSTGAGSLRFAWPSSYSRAVVEESVSLLPAVWGEVFVDSVVEGTNRVVTIPAPVGATRFYRVRN